MEKKGDLSDFKCSQVVGVRQTGLSISELQRIGQKKRKYPANDNCVDGNVLLKREESEATIYPSPTKLDNRRLGKSCPVWWTGLDFSCNIQMVGWEFGVNKLKAWIHCTTWQWFRLLLMVGREIHINKSAATAWSSRVNKDQNLWRMKVCHKELRQLWRQKGVQPFTTKVDLIKWQVSACHSLFDLN